MICITLRPMASSSTTSKRSGRAGPPVLRSSPAGPVPVTLCLDPSPPGAARLVVHEPLGIHTEAGGIQERRERGSQPGRNELADRPAFLVHAGLLKLEQVLHGNNIAFHADHFGDVRDPARAV